MPRPVALEIAVQDVAGALTASGAVDEAALAALADAAGGADLTFHRAFDVVADRGQALADLRQADVRRVLTSGGAPCAADGLAELRRLAPLATGLGVELMAGGGVRPGDVAALVAAGVDAVHLSARRAVAEAAGPGGGPAGYDVTDADVVAAAASAVTSAAARSPHRPPAGTPSPR
ncbi:copper homeostasis protein CutC [Xylanimonas protaetiae]|uniref:copper homeostasis protein CutC n=1 Tax=Xylanimonas protaetiae TaxID=2509457 RepID=UPI0013EB83FC|nr:copper homeostasis protein CutC [Xylanimonas protaetiae]